MAYCLRQLGLYNNSEDAGTLTPMAARIDRLPKRETPPGLTIVCLAPDDTARAVEYRDVVTQMLCGRDMPPYADPRRLEANASYYLGYVADADGCMRPVTTLQIARHPSGEMALIDDVATLPEYRHAGYSAAMLTHALDESDCEIAFLHSTEMGRPFYERLGFLELSNS